MQHSQMPVLVASLATTRDRSFRCCGKAIHPWGSPFTRTWEGRKEGAQGLPPGLRISRAQESV